MAKISSNLINNGILIYFLSFIAQETSPQEAPQAL